MSGLKLYADPISPVCRSVMLFMAVNNIEHEFVKIDLKTRQTVTNEDFIALNPNKAVPVIDDNGFVLTESSAILRYLAAKYKVPDHWYPSDLKARARVDEAISYFPGNLRCGCFFFTCILPHRTGQPRNEEKCADLRSKLKTALNSTESYFLKDRKFIGGGNLSIADLLYLGEVTQYWLCGNDIYKGRPNMERWMADCQAALAPHFEQIYTAVRAVEKSGHLKTEIDVSP